MAKVKVKTKKKKTSMPVDVKALMDIIADLDESRGLAVNVNLLFDATASDSLIECVLEGFSTEKEDANVRSLVLGDAVPDLPLPADLCIVAGGKSPLLGNAAHESRRMGTPTVVVVEEGQTFFVEDASRHIAREEEKETASQGAHKVACGWGIPVDDMVVVDPTLEDHPLEELGAWIVNNAPAKRVSLADDFSFIRRPLGLELTSGIALQNAAVGAVVLIPGADMPVITLNQAKLVLQMASVYGQPLDMSRAKEIAVVVAGAFGFRALARELCDIVPLLGWGIKGAVAYAGTVAMGYAALDYFDEGGRINGLAEVLTNAVGQVLDIEQPQE